VNIADNLIMRIGAHRAARPFFAAAVGSTPIIGMKTPNENAQPNTQKAVHHVTYQKRISSFERQEEVVANRNLQPVGAGRIGAKTPS
jgi:hypothetical protein